MASFLARETQSAAVKHDMYSRKSPIYKHIRGEYGLLTDTLHYCFIVTKKHRTVENCGKFKHCIENFQLIFQWMCECFCISLKSHPASLLITDIAVQDFTK